MRAHNNGRKSENMIQCKYGYSYMVSLFLFEREKMQACACAVDELNSNKTHRVPYSIT